MSQKLEGSERRRGSSTGIHSFMDVVAREAEEYAADHTTPLSPLLEEIEHFTLTSTPYPSYAHRTSRRALPTAGSSTLRRAAHRRRRYLYRILGSRHGRSSAP